MESEERSNEFCREIKMKRIVESWQRRGMGRLVQPAGSMLGPPLAAYSLYLRHDGTSNPPLLLKHFVSKPLALFNLHQNFPYDATSSQDRVPYYTIYF
jgi:hypothetical protein